MTSVEELNAYYELISKLVDDAGNVSFNYFIHKLINF